MTPARAQAHVEAMRRAVRRWLDAERQARQPQVIPWRVRRR